MEVGSVSKDSMDFLHHPDIERDDLVRKVYGGIIAQVPG